MHISVSLMLECNYSKAIQVSCFPPPWFRKAVSFGKWSVGGEVDCRIVAGGKSERSDTPAVLGAGSHTVLSRKVSLSLPFCSETKLSI